VRAIHTRIAPKQPFRSYTTMVITHRCLPGRSKRRLKFGLQSFLLRPNRHMANIFEQNRLSQSQGFESLLYRFYPSQDGFLTWNRISEFQRPRSFSSTGKAKTKVFFGIASRWKQPKKCASYLSRERTEFYGALG
jgi:hypothetical protein